MTDLDDALKSMADAEDKYCRAKAYSDGPVEEVFTSRRVRRLLQDMGVSFQTLLGNVVIDAVANKLKITAVVVPNDDARTALIAEVDADNRMAQVRPAVMRRALQLGDSYLSAWPALDDSGNLIPGKVRVSVYGPCEMRVLYDEDEPEKPRVSIQKWAVKTPAGKRTRVDLLYADRIEHYVSQGARSSKAGDFKLYEDDGRGAVEANPYGFPVFHFQGTGLVGEYGTPEHATFYGTQNKLIKLEASHMAGVDFNTLPQRLGLRDAGTPGPSPVDDLDLDDFEVSPDGGSTKSTGLEDRRSKLSSEPGSFWDLDGYRDVKQLEPGDPKVFLDPRAAYLREGSVASSTPLHLFDRTGQIPSGESLKTANDPLDAKAETRKNAFDPTWHDFYRFVLTILGHDDASVTVSWAPIESTDETTKLDQAKQKQDIGVPVNQSLKELGYKAEDVEGWMDTDGGLPQRVDLLAQLGDAMGNFASAVAAGLMDQATVQQVITKLLGDVTGSNDDGTG
ncbi:hypothetical protein ACIOD2_27220 [Amycolatopsis sp. NPDC088138]|uniref:hypothetical protein n=1 Tax=Amycolatopsis sp. NPDC088138 TaxID=3363938 RepID=UPI0037F9EE01